MERTGFREVFVNKSQEISGNVVLTDLLNGGLNQIIFLRRFCFVHEEVGVTVGLQVEYSKLAL